MLVPILAISLAVLWKTQRGQLKEEIHYHAGFIVYVDGKQIDFSDTKYMNIIPCAAPGQEVKEDEQIEKAHLHDNIGDVVHVEHEGSMWSDLFKNIHYDLPDSTKGYIDGVQVENILNQPITPYESVLFVTGSSDGVDTKEIISREHIEEVESKSESCGS